MGGVCVWFCVRGWDDSAAQAPAWKEALHSSHLSFSGLFGSPGSEDLSIAFFFFSDEDVVYQAWGNFEVSISSLGN
jgi:hypothetical protein